MAEPRTLDEVGGVKVDRHALRNPTSEISAEHINKTRNDAAEMTHTSPKAVLRFTTAVADTIADIALRSQWGDGDAQKPVIVRAGVGQYTLTWPVSFTNALGHVETVSLFGALAQGSSADETDDIFAYVLTTSGRVCTVRVESPKGTLADDGDASGDFINVTLVVW